jgi:hypothetical protein
VSARAQSSWIGCSRRDLLGRQIAQARRGPFAIVLDAPLFNLELRIVERNENVFTQAYMDPASAQGYFLMLRIGCSHISGLLLG